jgi:FtsZ-binding cell division protein ZapB
VIRWTKPVTDFTLPPSKSNLAASSPGSRAIAATAEAQDEWSAPAQVEKSLEILVRAAAAVDELIARNRAITDAAMRSIEHFRHKLRAAEQTNHLLQNEIEALKAERQALRKERESMRMAAEALRAECEAEIESHRRELERAQANIRRFNSQMADLLGAAERKLAETSGLPPQS